MTKMLLKLLIACLILGLSGEARAQEESLVVAPDAATVARAREHYLEGSRWLDGGQWAKALAAYEQAFALYPSASTLFNMAYCNSQLGRLVAAWLHVSEALRLSESSETLRLTPERRAAVEDERDRLRARVPSVLFQGTSPLEVNVFGGKIRQTADVTPVYYLETTSGAEEEWIHIPVGTRVLVDPGVHRLTIRVGGRLYPQHLVVAEGQTTVVVEPEGEASEGVSHQLSPTEAKVEPAQPAARVPTSESRAGETPPRPSPYRIPGVISLALGGASLLAAGVAVGVMVEAESALNGHCADDGTCPDTLASKVNQYQSAALAANVGIALGLGASTVGVGLLWLDRKNERQQVRAELGPASLRVRGTF